ncbi:MAG: HD domain-containing phosphohydrolase [Planctomycetota bacterium]
MTRVTGQLMVEPERKQLRALADHLLRREGVVVRVFDANGDLVLDAAEHGEPCTTPVEKCRDIIARKKRSVVRGAPSPDAAPADEDGVQVLPIERSSVYFGSLVACAAAEDAAVRDASTGAVLDAMHEILAEGSAKEHEIDSLVTELALQYEEIELLYEIDEKIPLRSYPSNVIDYVAEKAFNVLNCSCFAWVPHSGTASRKGDDCRTLWNPNEAEPPPTMLRLEAEQLARAVAEQCAGRSRPSTIISLDNDPELSSFSPELDSVMCLPLVVDADLYGYLIAFKPRGNQFTSYELKLMTALARKSAFVIRDSSLYEDLESLFFNLIKLLVNTIENKDQYTKGHSQRVKTFTVRLAELMGLPKEEIDTLRISGLLHDIGKQGIPDAVLKKEGKLDDEEFALIKTHPVGGVNLIKHIKQFEDCLPHIRHHHERVDGNGYPDGLSGNDIPQGARIIAVADTYDALTSNRCYRPPFSTEKAFEIIEEAAGTQLDAEVARALLDNRAEFARYSRNEEASRDPLMTPNLT